MKRRSESWRFQAISAQNSDRLVYVIIHSNSRLIKFFLHRLKVKWFLFPMMCFFVLSCKHKCLFDIMENGPIFDTPFFIPSVLHPLVFGSRSAKLGGGKQTVFRGYLSNWKAFHVCKNYWHFLRTVIVIKVWKAGKRLLTGSILWLGGTFFPPLSLRGFVSGIWLVIYIFF